MDKKDKNKISIDEKLDRIMEVSLFNQKMLLSSLKAMDEILSNAVKKQTESKIIKPVL